jgi:two-component system phosphate regulon sensor histidine kinase PhoR
LTGRIFIRLLAGAFCLLLVALVSVDYLAVRAAGSAYVHILTQQLREKCRMTALSVEPGLSLPPARLEALARAAGARLTLVRSDGLVMGDSDANPDRMENHRTRPELHWHLGQCPPCGGPLSWTLTVSMSISRWLVCI